MHVIPKSLLVCVSLAALIGCSKQTSPDEAAVQACFNGYKEAILDQDGAKAVTFVDANTLDYYHRMQDLALHGTRKTVQALSTMDKLMVLTLRHRLPLASLQQMTSEAVFVHAVDEGWIGKESVLKIELGAVSVSGTQATAVHTSDGVESPFKWEFHMEDGQWKLDLASIMPVANQAMQHVIEQSGMPEDEFLIAILEAVAGNKVPETVWEPMVK